MTPAVTRAACPECIKRGKTWNGDDPSCAFLSGVFDTENWNCAIANELRDIAERKSKLYCRDDLAAASFGALPFESEERAGYIVMTWYKNRGKCGRMMTMCDDLEPHVTTLEEAQDALAFWRNGGLR